MQQATKNHFSPLTALATIALVALAGCSTSREPKPIDPKTSATIERIKESELRAYCPQVTLLDGTAYHTQYEKGGDGDNSRVIHQSTITETTRACKYGEGTISIEVAAAGRVVPGPKFSGGSVNLPIRVAVKQGDNVIYSQLHRQAVAISGGAAAQFVMNDNAITIPTPDKQNIQIFVGFDDAPVAATKSKRKRN